MGEYYSWVNIDKKEYIEPFAFDMGNKSHESAWKGNPLLGALYALMKSDWKGDRVIFLGDETNITEKDTNPALQQLSKERKQWGEPGYDADYVVETYRDISGLFRDAEKKVREEIRIMIDADDFECNYYHVDKESPFDGLFGRLPAYYRYVYNHTKKEFYDLTRTRMTYTDRDGNYTDRIDPLPLLLAFGRSAGDECTGLWIGDNVEPGDDAPPYDYKDMSSVYVWDGHGVE